MSVVENEGQAGRAGVRSLVAHAMMVSGVGAGLAAGRDVVGLKREKPGGFGHPGVILHVGNLPTAAARTTQCGKLPQRPCRDAGAGAGAGAGA